MHFKMSYEMICLRINYIFDFIWNFVTITLLFFERLNLQESIMENIMENI